MSMENAKKLVEDLQTGKASLEEFEKDPAAFLAAGGYDCTVDEVQEVVNLARPLDDEELEAVTGGWAHCEVITLWKKIKGWGDDIGDRVKELF